ncbi:MAG: hypothetical protein US89_C0015G0023 [Candidatus Peregrinibacteria bacterium GW2011_GWF2_38_29]|nr:MAG: hypothetical protein US89_C0015G0023 [Candidatus Peregrinibacteria bacterium GW2011_GWF2_38_29]HBB02717.1 hypothetical protein [Candidatus Peregrinibacteria bacterium]
MNEEERRDREGDDVYGSPAQAADATKNLRREIDEMRNSVWFFYMRMLSLEGKNNGVAGHRDLAELEEQKLRRISEIFKALIDEVFAMPAPYMRHEAYVKKVCEKINESIKEIARILEVKEGFIFEGAEKRKWPPIPPNLESISLEESLPDEERLARLKAIEGQYKERGDQLSALDSEASIIADIFKRHSTEIVRSAAIRCRGLAQNARSKFNLKGKALKSYIMSNLDSCYTDMCAKMKLAHAKVDKRST